MSKYFSVKPSANSARSNFYNIASIQSIEWVDDHTEITLSNKVLSVVELSNEVFERILQLQENDILDFIEYIPHQGEISEEVRGMFH